MTGTQLGLIISTIYLAQGLEDKKFSTALGMILLFFTCIVALFKGN